jgi:hypothetical protein
MSEFQILRRQRLVDLIVGTSVTDSTTLRFDSAAGGSIFVNDVSTSATTLRVFGSIDDSAYRELYDPSGSAASITLARLSGTATETVGTTTTTITVYSAVDSIYAMPDAVFALKQLRLVADAALGESARVTVASKS